MPVTGLLPRDQMLAALPNAISFEKYPDLQKRLLEFFSLTTTAEEAPGRLEALLCCLPEVEVPTSLTYRDIFRVVILEFLDAHNFCISRVKRSCAHFVTPEGKIYPFDTYNLFYRDAAARDRKAMSLQGARAQLGEQ